tara:strand:+ start:63678 stop:63980 length:303 start_codon:yes stop_codon:yes gene_type:complete
MNWLLAQIYSVSGIQKVENDLENQLILAGDKSQQDVRNDAKQEALPVIRPNIATGKKNYNIFQPALGAPPCKCNENKNDQSVYPTNPNCAPLLTSAILEL